MDSLTVQLPAPRCSRDTLEEQEQEQEEYLSWDIQSISYRFVLLRSGKNLG